MDSSGSIVQLQEAVREFCERRDWDQFHNPKDLAIGIATEAGELLSLFRFLNEAESLSVLVDGRKREQVEDELADVLFFVLRFAQKAGIDLAACLTRKLAKNAMRYPIAKARGRNVRAEDL